jgi:molybdenum cofactor cytidylyltransferase
MWSGDVNQCSPWAHGDRVRDGVSEAEESSRAAASAGTYSASNRRVAALLLAAGLSSRMGRPKPLLPWGGQTLVEFQVGQMKAAGIDDVIVVTGHEAAAVSGALAHSGARVVFNPRFIEGRAGSVRTGAAALGEGVEQIVLLSVDQPRPAAITRALIEAHAMSGALIAVPRYDGRRGHPVVFAGTLLAELRTVDEAGEGLRAVRRAHAGGTIEVEVDDPRALLDVNTPGAYAEALRLFGLG